MPELRWILLGAGIALILGLWWWETRRPQASKPSAPGAPDVRTESAGGVAESDVESAASYAPTIERVRVERRPPIIEIPEDLEVDVSDFIGIERRHSPQLQYPSDDQEPMRGDTDEPGDHKRAPWVRTQPLELDEVAPQRTAAPQRSSTDDVERRTAEASQQRIVALRLVAPAGPWRGADLRAAFAAEGLEFGPYSIFHRPREDGKTLFYVASLMEPGSFDPAGMDEQEFSGISLFGVVPGLLDAPAVFDLVLSAGRSLAARLNGQLQDEQGSTLTAQRILNLREELVHFEHRNRRLRRS